MTWWIGVYQGIKSARKNKLPNWRYEELETTPWLYDTPYLFQLYEKAQYDSQKEKIHDYLNKRFKVTHLPDYWDLNEMLEKDMKIGSFEPKSSKKHLQKRDIYMDDFKKLTDEDEDGVYFPF